MVVKFLACGWKIYWFFAYKWSDSKEKKKMYFLISSQIFIQWGNWILFLNQNAFMFKETKFAVESLNFMIS